MANILSVVKKIFSVDRDYRGRSISQMFDRYASQTGTHPHEWSYIREKSAYEHTTTGRTYYPHECSARAA